MYAMDRATAMQELEASVASMKAADMTVIEARRMRKTSGGNIRWRRVEDPASPLFGGMRDEGGDLFHADGLVDEYLQPALQRAQHEHARVQVALAAYGEAARADDAKAAAVTAAENERISRRLVWLTVVIAIGTVMQGAVALASFYFSHH